MERKRKLPIQIAVRAIIVNSEQKVMLVKRSEGTYDEGKWCLVGGRLNEGERLEKAISREVREEIDSEFELSHWTEVENPDITTGTRWLTHYFVGISETLPAKFDSREVSDVGFFTKEEIDELNIAFDHKSILMMYFKN